MSFRVYTKTGDKGTTGLLGGTRVPKNHIRIESYGTVDELNSCIGYVSTIVHNEAIETTLLHIQDRLFVLGSQLATDPDKDLKMSIPALTDADVKFLESHIDKMDEIIEPLKFFVLPGGHPAAAYIHVARCVCRRAERLCVDLQERENSIPQLYIQYLNRLSDYLFVLSRYILHINNIKDVPWIPEKQ